MSAASEKAAQMLRERFAGEVCQLWPRCGCHETLRRWLYDLNDAERVWPRDVLEWAETSIFISLACVARHCPDPVVKAYAAGQLRDKFWDHQRAMGKQ
jgi:hypothetical protein